MSTSDKKTASADTKRKFMLINPNNHNDVYATFRTKQPCRAAAKAVNFVSKNMRKLGEENPGAVKVCITDGKVVKTYLGISKKIENPNEHMLKMNKLYRAQTKYIPGSITDFNPIYKNRKYVVSTQDTNVETKVLSVDDKECKLQVTSKNECKVNGNCSVMPGDVLTMSTPFNTVQSYKKDGSKQKFDGLISKK